MNDQLTVFVAGVNPAAVGATACPVLLKEGSSNCVHTFFADSAADTFDALALTVNKRTAHTVSHFFFIAAFLPAGIRLHWRKPNAHRSDFK